ncbi:MAG: cell division protein FtsW [Fuerstiella sp.]|nr:cell division protein FtsW [Fuerstiella sp.]MCP4855463.1 cell division protein FtsW [Fuerstiella sp.]
MRRLFIGLVCVLIGVGVQMVHSASLTSTPGRSEAVFLNRHLTFLAISVVCGFAASMVPASFLKKNSTRLLIAFVLLLVAVLIPGIGTRVNGAQRWLRLSGLSIQPSELGRIIMPIVAAKTLIDIRSASGFSLRTLPRTLLPLLMVLPLVVIEPDLGATVFLAAGYVTALFIGGWPLRYFIGCTVLALPAAVSLLALKSYQMKRITGFMAAWQDLSQAPWQIRQSLMSLGSGGLEGTGIGGGWQKLSYLPEANTDFVFAVIGEELGLSGTLAVVIVWMGVFLTGRAVMRPLRRDSFEWILGSTLVIQIVLQALANVAVVTAMVPPKGVPHPFISYGGTNLLVNVVAVGMVVGLSRRRPVVPGSEPEATGFPRDTECRDNTAMPEPV